MKYIVRKYETTEELQVGLNTEFADHDIQGILQSPPGDKVAGWVVIAIDRGIPVTGMPPQQQATAPPAQPVPPTGAPSVPSGPPTIVKGTPGENPNPASESLAAMLGQEPPGQR